MFSVASIRRSIGDLRRDLPERRRRVGGLEGGRRAGVELALEEIVGCLEGRHGLVRDDELGVEPAEREVGLGDVRDQRQQDAAPRVLGREVAGLRGFVEPPDPAPDVELPAEVDVGRDLIRRDRGEREHLCRVAAARPSDAGLDRRKVLRAGDPGAGPSLVDARRRELHVVSVAQGLVDEAVQDRVLEDFPPGLVGQRRRGSGRSLDVAIHIRNGHRRLLVVGADGTTRQHGQPEEGGELLPHVSALLPHRSGLGPERPPRWERLPWPCPFLCPRASRRARRARGSGRSRDRSPPACRR